MRIRDLQPYIKRLLTEFDGFIGNRDLVLAQPVNRILRGFCFDRSIDKTAFYVNAFIQPLYVPFTTIDLTLGERLEPYGWKCTESGVADQIVEAARAKGVALIEAGTSPERVADWIATWRPGPKSSSVQQPYAFSLAAAHRFGEAEVELERLHSLLGKTMQCDWVTGMTAEVEQLLDRLKNKPDEVDGLLVRWEEGTLSHLATEYGPLR